MQAQARVGRERSGPQHLLPQPQFEDDRQNPGHSRAGGARGIPGWQGAGAGFLRREDAEGSGRAELWTEAHGQDS